MARVTTLVASIVEAGLVIVVMEVWEDHLGISSVKPARRNTAGDTTTRPTNPKQMSESSQSRSNNNL